MSLISPAPTWARILAWIRAEVAGVAPCPHKPGMSSAPLKKAIVFKLAFFIRTQVITVSRPIEPETVVGSVRQPPGGFALVKSGCPFTTLPWTRSGGSRGPGTGTSGGVVDAQQVQDRGVQVVDVDRFFDDVVREVVGLAVGDARLDAAAGQPHR